MEYDSQDSKIAQRNMVGLSVVVILYFFTGAELGTADGSTISVLGGTLILTESGVLRFKALTFTVFAWCYYRFTVLKPEDSNFYGYLRKTELFNRLSKPTRLSLRLEDLPTRNIVALLDDHGLEPIHADGDLFFARSTHPVSGLFGYDDGDVIVKGHLTLKLPMVFIENETKFNVYAFITGRQRRNIIRRTLTETPYIGNVVVPTTLALFAYSLMVFSGMNELLSYR